LWFLLPVTSKKKKLFEIYNEEDMGISLWEMLTLGQNSMDEFDQPVANNKNTLRLQQEHVAWNKHTPFGSYHEA
jgi:hypothetical protein